MNHLLDTGVWLRAVVEPTTLPAAIRSILTHHDARFGLSAISLWEIAKKAQTGKLSLAMDTLTWLKAATPDTIHVLPLTAEIVAEATQLKNFPTRDPADELIVATARIHRLTLLTTDTRLKRYPHARIHYFTLQQPQQRPEKK